LKHWRWILLWGVVTLFAAACEGEQTSPQATATPSPASTLAPASTSSPVSISGHILYVTDREVSGYTESWQSHLRMRGWKVDVITVTTPLEIVEELSYDLIVIGAIANTNTNAPILQRVIDAGLPTLIGDQDVVGLLDKGANTFQGGTAYGTSINITKDHPLVSDYLGEVQISNEETYRNPVEADGIVLATAENNEGSSAVSGPVWILRNNWIYFGVWGEFSPADAYWVFFDRSVDYLSRLGQTYISTFELGQGESKTITIGPNQVGTAKLTFNSSQILSIRIRKDSNLILELGCTTKAFSKPYQFPLSTGQIATIKFTNDCVLIPTQLKVILPVIVD
jgi:hypothetical protein